MQDQFGGQAIPPFMDSYPDDSSLLFSAFLKASTDRIYFKDLESRFIKINSVMAKFLGLTDPQDAIGKTDFDFFAESHARKARQDELQIIQSGIQIPGIEEQESWPDGRVTWALSTKWPLENLAGKCVGTFGISRDITVVKHADAAFRAVFESNPCPMYITDPGARRFVAVNEAMVRQYGYSDLELSAISIVDIHAENDLPDLPQDAPVSHLGLGNLTKSEHRKKDGTIIDVESAYRQIVFQGQQAILVSVQDITVRSRSEEELNRLSIVVEQCPVSVLITDIKGRIIYVNREFTRASGFEANEVLGKSPNVLKSGHTTSESYRELWKTIRGGSEWRGVFHNRKKSGDLFWESAVIRPIRDSLGSITHFVAMKEDITSKLELELQLRQSQKLESLGQLAAGIAHEINTPIQYIGDNTSFIRDSWAQVSALLVAGEQLRGDESCRFASTETLAAFDRCTKQADIGYISAEIPRALDQTQEGVQRVAQIVRAMKEFSHPGSEEKLMFDLNRAIESTISISRNEWKYAARVQTDLDPDLPLVPCFPGDINQVLLNILVNASHAVADIQRENGDELGTITISTKSGTDWVEVSVTDTGTGIPDHARDRVFDPFFTTKEVGKGTGQGLNLAHTVVVKKHGGRIWFDSKVGQGTTFFIRLPLSAPTEHETSRAGSVR